MINSDSQFNNIHSRFQWWDLGVVILVCLPFLFVGIGSISFLDPDEGLYGSIAREMAEKGDWVTPHFNSVRYLEKPPLQYWLSALTIAVFGPSEWAVRLWSAIPAFGVSLLLWRLGVLLYGREAGIAAAIVFSTSVGVFRYVRVAATDFLLVFSLTLSIYAFVKCVLSLRNRSTNCSKGSFRGLPVGSLLMLYTGLSLGMLSKGLIGLVFPITIIVIFFSIVYFSKLWNNINLRTSFSSAIQFIFMSRYALIGLLIFLLLCIPWHVIAGLRNQGFFEFYFIDNQILRFLSARFFIEDDIPIQTFSFLAVTFIWFFPWSTCIFVSIFHGYSWNNSNLHLNESLRILIGVWAFSILLFFSLSSSKLEHYSFPAIPAMSLIVGGLWYEAFKSSRISVSDQGSINKSQVAGLKFWLGLLSIGSILSGIFLLSLSDNFTPNGFLSVFSELNVYYRILKEQGSAFPFESLTPFIALLKLLASVLIVGPLLSYLLFNYHLPKYSFAVLIVVAGIIGVFVTKLLLVIEDHHSARPIARVLLDQSRMNDLIVHEGSLEYSAGLPYYTGQNIYVLNGKRGDLDFGSRYPESLHLFLDDKRFVKMWEGIQRVFLVTRSEVKDSIINRVNNKNFFLIGRYGSRWIYSNFLNKMEIPNG